MKNINNTKQKNEARWFLSETKRCFAIVLMLLVFSLFGKVNGQIPTWEWAKGIGGTGDDQSVITLDASGNIYMTGSFSGTVDFDPGVGVFNLTSAGGTDIFISKLDSSGNFLWAERIGGTSNDYGTSIQLDNLGNIYFGGAIDGTVDFDPGQGIFNIVVTGSRMWYICQFDNDGNFIWIKAHKMGNDNYRESIAIDAAGNAYGSGGFSGTIDFDPGSGTFNLTSAGYDIYIFKLNSAGNFVWAYSFGTNAGGDGTVITTDGSGNVYVGGNFEGTIDFDPGPAIFNLSGSYPSIFLLKLNSTGNFVWAKGLVKDNSLSFGPFQPTDISIDPYGNVVTTGYFYGTADFDPGLANYNLTTSYTRWDCFISKLNSSGNFVWAKSFRAGIIGTSYHSDFDAAGNVYTLGVLADTADLDPGPGIFNVTSMGYEDCFISKLDTAGNFVWGKTMGGAGSDGATSLVCDDAGSIFSSLISNASVTFGTITLTNHGSNDIFIAKLSEESFDCSTITCSITPTISVIRVSNASCNNGQIKVHLGGTFKGFPHVELHDSTNTIISSVNLTPGTANYTFKNLTLGSYMVKVFDLNCCEEDFAAVVKCGSVATGLKTKLITDVSAKPSWQVASCVVSYKLQYREQGTSTWNCRTVIGTQGYRTIVNLTPSTTYEWHVGNICNGYNGYLSYTYSPIQTFTTLALREGQDAISNFTERESFDINLYPNPATYTLTVNFEIEDAAARLKVINTVGQIAFEKQLNSDEGSFEEQLDVSKLNTGVYMLLVKTEQGVSMKKFAKE